MGKMSEVSRKINEAEELKEKLYNPARSKNDMAVRLDRLANDMKLTAQQLFQYSTANATELMGAGNQLNDWARELRGDLNE